ncbi:MAG TPA: O-antigen translocase [Pseudomonadales bacterium]
MTLIKTSLLNAIAVAIRMLTLLGLNKILAIYVGPSGYAVIGQFQNALTMVMTFAGGAINTGVTKYTAEYYASESQQHTVWQTAFIISLVFTFVISIFMAVFNRWLAEVIFKDAANGSIFLWLSVTLILFVLNSLLLAIINGKKEIRLYITINIAGSLIALVFTGFLTYFYGLYGALISLVTNQSVVFILTLWLCRQQAWFKFSHFWGVVDNQVALNLGKYVLMALTSAVAIPVTHMFIRSHLISNFGLEGAGYWDAIWRISSIYLMFVTTTLGIYYLPRLSEISEKKEFRKEIFSGFKIILPIAFFSSLAIYLFRDLIVSILFTEDFASMTGLFAWQMAGDVVKIASWLLGYSLIAKGLAKEFIIKEILVLSVFYFLTVFFTSELGLPGVVKAHFYTYICNFLLIFFILKNAKLI